MIEEESVSIENNDSIQIETYEENIVTPELTPIEKWIQKSPLSRKAEIDYILNANLENKLQITESGDVQQVFCVEKWMFLLVIDKMFPKLSETDEIPIKVCLVFPNLADLQKQFPGKKIPFVQKDSKNNEYLKFDDFDDEFERYTNGCNDKLLSETLILNTTTWVEGMKQAIKNENEKKKRRGFGSQMPSWFNFGRTRTTYNDGFFGEGLFGETRPKYVDGRHSDSGTENTNCKKVVLSDRAYIQIFNESQSRIQTETGGLLLGHFEDGVWYVVEASDPGINAKFYNAYHEGDDVYENHVCGVISRTYKYPLVFLGMWHRHPGSLDSFSGTDDGTNYKYAGSAGNGCVSAIINYDPEFRITFYYAEQGNCHNVYYTKVDVEVGDDKIPNKEMLKIASREDVLRRHGR